MPPPAVSEKMKGRESRNISFSPRRGGLSDGLVDALVEANAVVEWFVEAGVQIMNRQGPGLREWHRQGQASEQSRKKNSRELVSAF